MCSYAHNAGELRAPKVHARRGLDDSFTEMAALKCSEESASLRRSAQHVSPLTAGAADTRAGLRGEDHKKDFECTTEGKYFVVKSTK